MAIPVHRKTVFILRWDPFISLYFVYRHHISVLLICTRSLSLTDTNIMKCIVISKWHNLVIFTIYNDNSLTNIITYFYILSKLSETCIHKTECLYWLHFSDSFVLYISIFYQTILYKHYLHTPSIRKIVYLNTPFLPKGSSHTYTLNQETRTIGFSAVCAYLRPIMYPQPLGIYSLPHGVLPCLDTRGRYVHCQCIKLP